jgi:AraC family transcriptional regulator of adaptative response / DNA-3-methyladenine glycosylase II
MNLDPETCYQAILARDRRFDGNFFVGVSTTGIYCRTVCPAKTPRQDRCTFYATAAAAERAGYRPCLRCRPELAPGRARIDAIDRLAARAFGKIEDGVLDERSLGDLAAELGVSDRHLRRAVERSYGVSPVELAQTQRLLTAKRLLTDTDLPVGEIAFASGFSSLRRFNALFQERYRLAPAQLRKNRGRTSEKTTLICEIPYHEPFDWDWHLGFLAKRAILGVEEVADGVYRRAIAIRDHVGLVEVRRVTERRVLQAEISTSLAPVLPKVLAKIKLVFDVETDPRPIVDRLGEVACENPGIRVPGAVDGFEIAVRGILGQQVSVQGARTVAGRLVEKFGSQLPAPAGAITHLFPSARTLAEADPEDISILGMPRARGRTINALATAVADRSVDLRPGADVDLMISRMTSLPGVGEWTAQYVAMRAMAWPDAFPFADLGIRKALGLTRDREVLAAAEAWRPWRAYAAMHLWHSLEKKHDPVHAN